MGDGIVSQGTITAYRLDVGGIKVKIKAGHFHGSTSLGNGAFVVLRLARASSDVLWERWKYARNPGGGVCPVEDKWLVPPGKGHSKGAMGRGASASLPWAL